MLLITTIALSGCGSQEEPNTPSRSAAVASNATSPAVGDAAVWDLAPQQELGKSSTKFTALVSRLGCNDGVTGDVVAPDIRVTATEVTVTFRVLPKQIGAADCQGNNKVQFEVDFGEPLAGKSLVDGECCLEARPHQPVSVNQTESG